MNQKQKGYKMNQKQKDFYLQNRASKCPYCHSENIQGTGQRDFDDDWASNEIECLDCNKQWKDIYILQDVVDI